MSAPTFGAIPTAHGIGFRVWAPEARSVQLHLVIGNGHGGQISIFYPTRRIENRDLTPASSWEDGIWEVTVALLDTDAAFALDSCGPRIDAAAGVIGFQRPGAVVFAGAR